MHKQLYESLSDGREILFLDECVFTFNTMQKRAWSLPKQNIQFTESNINLQATSVLAVISKESGLFHYVIVPKAIDREILVGFIDEIVEKGKGK